MASSFHRIFPILIKRVSITKPVSNTVTVRNLLTAPSGAVLPEPKKIPFPFMKIILVLTPGIYIGAAIAKNGATILEENEIFVPSDDDDDD